MMDLADPYIHRHALNQAVSGSAKNIIIVMEQLGTATKKQQLESHRDRQSKHSCSGERNNRARHTTTHGTVRSES